MFQFFQTLVKKCIHSRELEKNWVLPQNALFPLEIFQHIRSFITEASTFIAFSKAFQIPVCQHLFCQVLAEQKWLEVEELDSNSILSIAETEYNKINNDLRYYAFLFPTCYKIMEKENGLALITYKKHLVPFNYETFFSTSSLLYTPYIDHHNFEQQQQDNHHFVYTPHRLLHIYNPLDHKHVLHINEKMPTFLKKKYKEIEHVVKSCPSKAIRIEPWTKCFHQTLETWAPCQEWVDYLIQVYTFQQEKSNVLKQFRNRVR